MLAAVEQMVDEFLRPFAEISQNLQSAGERLIPPKADGVLDRRERLVQIASGVPGRVENVANVGDISAEDREESSESLDVLKDLTQPLGIASEDCIELFEYG